MSNIWSAPPIAMPKQAVKKSTGGAINAVILPNFISLKQLLPLLQFTEEDALEILVDCEFAYEIFIGLKGLMVVFSQFNSTHEGKCKVKFNASGAYSTWIKGNAIKELCFMSKSAFGKALLEHYLQSVRFEDVKKTTVYKLPSVLKQTKLRDEYAEFKELLVVSDQYQFQSDELFKIHKDYDLFKELIAKWIPFDIYAFEDCSEDELAWYFLPITQCSIPHNCKKLCAKTTGIYYRNSDDLCRLSNALKHHKFESRSVNQWRVKLSQIRHILSS